MTRKPRPLYGGGMKPQELFSSDSGHGASAIISVACMIYIAWSGFLFGQWLAR